MLLFARKMTFIEAEKLIRAMPDEVFTTLYNVLHGAANESYMEIKFGTREKHHVSLIREILEDAGLPEYAIATKNLEVVCKAISKRHHLDQLRL